MDEVLLKQLTRQLKLLNFWISVFGGLFLIGLIVIGVLVYKVVTFTHHAETSINNLQQKTSQTLNFQQKACSSSGLGSLLKKDTSACQ